MDNRFFEKPILNSPYEYPARHWELDANGQPTQRIIAKIKKSTMETYWVPGANNLGTYGRWAFAEFTDIYEMQEDFAKKVESEFNKMIDKVVRNED